MQNGWGYGGGEGDSQCWRDVIQRQRSENGRNLGGNDPALESEDIRQQSAKRGEGNILEEGAGCARRWEPREPRNLKACRTRARSRAACVGLGTRLERPTDHSIICDAVANVTDRAFQVKEARLACSRCSVDIC